MIKGFKKVKVYGIFFPVLKQFSLEASIAIPKLVL